MSQPVRMAKLYDRGQIVIPSPIRKILNLKRGTLFVVTVHRGRIILKPVTK